MTSYAPDHAWALTAVADAGAAVTFTRKTPGTLDEATGLYTGASSSTIAGYAVDTFAGAGKTFGTPFVLKDDEDLAFFFTPTTFGSLPIPGDTVSWNSTTYTVRRVIPLAPGGTALGATVTVGR